MNRADSRFEGPVGAGIHIAERRASDHELSGRLLSAQEEERCWIARELHDNLGQQVALLAIEIDQLATTLAGISTTVTDDVRKLALRTAEISTEIHNLSHRLHSAKLETLGLVAAARGLCREFMAQGIAVEFLAPSVPVSLSYDVMLCLFRIAQEGLNNVVKHSGAHEARLTLTRTLEALTLTILDAGRGFDPAGAANQGGLGLASMRERLRSIGGELTITSRVGQGTTIGARVPLGHVAGPTASVGRRTHRLTPGTKPVNLVA